MDIQAICSELDNVGAPITDHFPGEEMSGGGILVDEKYLIQISRYESNPIILSMVDEEGEVEDVSSFASVSEVVQFIMEH